MNFRLTKLVKDTRHRWLIPVILVIQEAEIRRISVHSQPGQIVLMTLSQENSSHKRAGRVLQGVALSSNPSTTRKKKKRKEVVKE
jgi:hypothetical protein